MNLFGEKRKYPPAYLRIRVNVLNFLEHSGNVVPRLGLDVYLVYRNLANLPSDCFRLFW